MYNVYEVLNMEKENKTRSGKWFLRASTMLLILILSLCSALSYGIWRSSENSISKATEGQISLAWLKESEFLPNSKSDTQLYPYSQLQETYAAADSSTYVDSVDARFQCMAHAGLNTVVSDECGISVPSSVDKPYTDSVIVGTCTEIEFKSLSHKTVDTGKIQCFGYVVTIKIDKNLSPVLDPDYPYSYIKIMSSQVMADFSDFFIVGSKYIINGTVSYLPSPLKEDQAPYFTLAEADISLPTTDVKFEEDMYEKIGISTKTKISTLGGVYYDLTSCYLAAYSDPSYLSYAKIEGTFDEFLSSDKNSSWNSIITRRKTTKESVKIATANDIMSIPIFSSGRAYIAEGASFTEEDYSSGRKLCLISSQLADSNNIKVGDILDLKFWSNGYTLETNSTGTSWSPNLYKPGSDFLDEGSYTVAGIYEDDEAWGTQCFGFTPNTVIIPETSVNEDVKMQSSLTDLGGDRYTGMPESRAYVLKSGKASAFEAEMEAKGYGGMFYYYEQADPSLPNLNSLSDKSRIVTYISTSALTVAVASMAVYAIVKNIRSKDKKIRLRAVLTAIIISAASILISAVICLSFYGSIMDAANEGITAEEASLQELKTEPSLPAPEPVSAKTTLDRIPSPLLMAFAIQTGTLLLILCISSALCLIIRGGEKIEKTKMPYRLKNGRGIKGGMPAVIWYSITQSARSAVTGTLMIMLVSLSSIFMFLSVSTWLTARSSISEAERAYTSIAVAYENEFLKDIKPYDGIYYYDSLIGLYDAAEKSEHLEYADIRDRCMAYSSAIKTTTSGMVDEYTPISAVDYPYDLSVVVGTCVSVEYKRSYEFETSWSDDNLNILRVVAELELDFNASPVLSDDYSYSRYISVGTDQFDADFSDIFQVGEKYILYGSKTYSQYPKTEMYRDSKTVFYIENILPIDIHNRDENDPNYEVIKFEQYMHEILGTDSSTDIVINNPTQTTKFKLENCYFRVFKDDANMAYAKLDGTLEDFLSSDRGQKWNRLIDECKTTISSLKMNFTEDLDSILLFNQGLAYITEGRTFTEQEYSDGAKVCIISAETARDSSIKVGDKIDFSFWHNGYTLEHNQRNLILNNIPFCYGCEFFEEGTYEVIGIYKAESTWSPNEFFLTPNNAFAPKGSIEGQIKPELPGFIISGKIIEETNEIIHPVFGQYQSIPNTPSYVIKPGHIEDFEKEMESLGYGGMFYYYDQGYSMISPILDSLRESTSLLMNVSVAVWVVVLSAFFIIMASRSRKTAGIMMSLGTKRSHIFVHMLVMLMCVIIISSLAGGIAGYFMYDGIVGRIYEEAREDNVNLEFSSFKTDQSISGTYDSSLIESFDLKKSPQSVFIIGGIQLILLSSASAVMAKRYSMMEPLALLKGAGRIKGRKKK